VNVTSAEWQITPCDPTWQVCSRSGVATLRTAVHLLLLVAAYLMFVRQINDDDDEERKRKKRIFARAVRSFRPTSCLAAAVGLFRSASDGSVTCERQRTSTTTFWCGARPRRSSSQSARSFDAVRSSIIDGHGRRLRGGDAGLRRPHVGKPVAATPIFSPPHGRLTTEIRETARNDPTQKRTNYLLQLSSLTCPGI